ncbi:NADH dehydrogenase 1 alpha subcomplex assembly factor 3 [Lyophyllum atratum]|nr:NADH dehydrogenase 1 alpha subcomplex assembly factor 3 [Lyophyllum atratum]
MSLARILQRVGPQLLRRPSLLISKPCRRSLLTCQSRRIHVSAIRRDSSFTNILADDNPPAVQVKSITNQGIQLMDGLLIPSSCIFLEGKVFLWDVPSTLWVGWEKEHFEIFETVVPKPEILLFGTGKTISQIPPQLRTYLNQLGIQVDVMDTRNACSTYNLLAEEGRRVAAALLPLSPHPWKKMQTPA